MNVQVTALNILVHYSDGFAVMADRAGSQDAAAMAVSWARAPRPCVGDFGVVRAARAEPERGRRLWLSSRALVRK